jgi:hypothetical protein
MGCWSKEQWLGYCDLRRKLLLWVAEFLDE